MLRILVIRLSSIGDIVHALPAVSALAECLPEAEITWAVEKRYAGLLDENPCVKRVIPLDTLGWRARWARPRTAREVARTLGELRSRQPDVALDFQGLVKSAVIARLSGARRRIGFGGRWLREPLAATFYTERAEAEGRQHVVEENFALTERLGVRPVSRERWSFPLARRADVEERVEGRLAALGAERFVVVNPGGGWMSKRWAPEKYAELVRELGQDGQEFILITGSPAEQTMIQEIVTRAGTRGAVYFPSTVSEYIALARRATLFVGGDTGPLHLAAAVGTPIVAIYGPTSPARNGPFAPADISLSNQERTNASGSPPDSHAHWHGARAKNSSYLEGVTVEAVRAAIQQRLAVADER